MANYVRVLRRGTHNVRVLLENGETQLVRVVDLPNWTCVGGNVEPIATASRAHRTPRTGFVNPESQEDRIYVSISRRGSRNCTVVLENGTRVQVPNEYMSTWLRNGSAAYINWSEQNLYPNGRELRHLTFGIELEFVANPDKYNDFCEAMREVVGADRFMDPMRYGCSSTSKWSLQTDSSVRSTSSRTYKRGYELTSPILKFDDASKEELSKVLNTITIVFEGIVNKTCGTHVHVGNFARIQGNPEIRSQVLAFQHNYGAYEVAVFDRLVSPSRKGNNNHYCKSCNTYVIHDRYYKMNAQNIFGFGTLENRQHQGTLEVKKIWAWMELNGRYMIKFFADPSQFNDTTLSLEDFMDKIDLSEETKQFFLIREAELN